MAESGKQKNGWQERVRPVIEALVQSDVLPGIVLAVAEGDAEPAFLVLGTDAAGRPLADDTLLPVASITKLATALAVLRLVAAGTLALDDPLARHLPDAAAAAEEAVTLRTLLCHTAGLPGDLADGAAPYAPGLDWPELASACLRTPPIGPPGKAVYYSNVGYGLLALAVERVTRQAFPAVLQEQVLAPLGIEGYLGSEPPRPPARVAGNLGEHTGTALEPYNSEFWRSLALPWGGLVTDAAGALALVRAFAGRPGGFLPSSLLMEATSDQTGGLGGGYGAAMPGMEWPHCPWGLGPELRGEKLPHVIPAAASAGSFGHPGASGCVAWLDPEARLAWAMLGARTAASWVPSWLSIGAAILPEPPSP